LKASPLASPRHRTAVLVAAILIVGAMLQLSATWPGIMVWDAIRQYGQALSGHYDDWHPPAMNWLWRQLGVFGRGPAPMAALQALLYWGGFALIAYAAARRGRTGAAIAIALCALLPIPLVLVGTVLKDSLMAGGLLMTAGLIALRREDDRILRIIAGALLLATATLRFNAAAACLPLLVTLFPATWRQSSPRLLLAAAVGLALLVMAMPVANRMLRAEPSGVQLSLVLYDLGGIGRFSGTDAFPPMASTSAKVVAVNAGCYNPVSWDSYAWWVDHPCPIGFADVRNAFRSNGIDPYRWWLGQIVAHPIAYFQHRLAHFDRNTHFLLPDDAALPGLSLQTDPNPWGFQLPPNSLRRTLGAIAAWSGGTPIGWPAWWIALGLGCLALLPALRRDDPARPILLSALLYAFSYLPLSVASEIRYHLWTMIGVAIACASLAPALISGAASFPRWRIVAALVPVALVTILGISARLMG